ncbi:OprD family outer membrane porin [Sulfurimonas paralvinellae]|uniref:OprD family porin n=1 Tax=Sulfurimonas paralvinellae TaxID=317658 RepID=A0A7M1B9T6_9BACT|nr:OprD family outer membrane porin [Sulfurimonas paralvinellae]QOP46487.1 OprD family porin [Sulfurimonas paralvinellae]
MKRRYSLLLLFTLTASLSQAEATLPKQALKTNGQLIYQEQKTAEIFKEMFQQGDFYGRLRSNNFYFGYDHDDSGHESNLVSSVGASFVFRSASLNNFDFTLGLYGSQAFFSADDFKNNISFAKAAKDTFSRYKYITNGSKSLFAFGQANISYSYSKTNFRAGRQLVETFYTKSNDTKMIPNSFDGLVVSSKDIKKTKLTLAYLAKQKLRDHESAHSVLMYDDSNSANHSQWTGNDDSAMHKGLSYTNLKAAGKKTDAPLIILDAQNNSVKNLKINFSSYVVPSLLSQVMGELNYKIALKSFSITHSVRYIEQFDNGAGDVGGASITTDTTGYKDPNSLNSGMIAARIVTKIDDYKLNLGYTQVLDKADLVTPWRGFPTAGYTRSMGMYNWRANVKSYRIELVKGANAKGIYTKPFLQTSVLYMDGDTNKKETDSMFYYAGIVQNIPSMQELQYRVRLGWRDFIGDSSQVSDYLDARFELNYLF